MGKSLAQGVAEVRFSADIFDYYAENGPRLLASEEIPTGSDAAAIIERRPYGVLLGIMPWNYPYYQAARFVAPNLLAGNTVLLKPAESCPLSAQALQTLLADSGLPAGVDTKVLADHVQIAQIIADARVRGVSLTGSERAGVSVARIAGENLKKVVLELGGSDAHVVLDTADVAASAELAWEMRMENMGQACNSNKRIIVNAGIADRFIGELTARARRLVPGDPLTLQNGEYPPMSSRAAAQALLAQVEDAVAKRALLHARGFLPDRATAHFAPAVLTGVAPGMRAYDERAVRPCRRRPHCERRRRGAADRQRHRLRPRRSGV